MDVWQTPCAQFIGAIGHHTFFLQDASARARLQRFCTAIRQNGVAWFLKREYPQGLDKAIIVNRIGDALYVVDGNAHLLSLVLCDASITLRALVQAAGHQHFVRIWQDGWEAGSGQREAYETYIPPTTDTTRVPQWRAGVDGFKQPPISIKIIPSNVPFDSACFAACDRGRPLQQTAQALTDGGWIRL